MSAGTASPAAGLAEGRPGFEPPAELGQSPSGQLALFVSDRRRLPAAATLADASWEPGVDPPRVTNDRQIALFAPAVVLARDEALVEAAPECLPALALVLIRSPNASDGRRRARVLVRDALLAGCRLESLDFTHDEPLSDVLAEDLPPRWLACLGVIRRLWMAAHAEPDPAPFGTPLAGSQSDDEAALEFWHCLQVAEDATCTDELVHEARRRMKRLRPELHALYMRRAATRPG